MKTKDLKRLIDAAKQHARENESTMESCYNSIEFDLGFNREFCSTIGIDYDSITEYEKHIIINAANEEAEEIEEEENQYLEYIEYVEEYYSHFLSRGKIGSIQCIWDFYYLAVLNFLDKQELEHRNSLKQPRDLINEENLKKLYPREIDVLIMDVLKDSRNVFFAPLAPDRLLPGHEELHFTNRLKELAKNICSIEKVWDKMLERPETKNKSRIHDKNY